MIRLFLAASAGAIVIVVAGFLLWPSVTIAAAPHWPCGVASWYGPESGSRTATGEHFDGSGLTAAMPDRKHLGEHYRVHYGHFSVDVRINDVGPRKDLHRIIDLSRDAAVAIGLIGRGVGTVCLERLLP